MKLLDKAIKNQTESCLIQAEWNLSAAAFMLGVCRSKLYRMLKKYNLKRGKNGI